MSTLSSGRQTPGSKTIGSAQEPTGFKSLHKWQEFPSLQEVSSWTLARLGPEGLRDSEHECALVSLGGGRRKLFFPAKSSVQWDFNSEVSAKGTNCIEKKLYLKTP